MKLSYRILPPEEWGRLTSIMEDKFIPSPDAASAAVAEDESGEIVGVWFLQLALHMEPLVLKSPAVNFCRLHDALFKGVDSHKGLRIYCFSDKERVDAMARKVGMTELPATIFVKEV